MDYDALQRAPLFRAMSPESAAALRHSATETSLRRAEVLFKQGDPGDRVYIVLGGAVKLSQSTSAGRENLLAVAGPGQMFGELSFFDLQPRSATATAVTKTSLACLSYGTLTLWLQGRPDVALALLGQLASQVRKANALKSDLIYSDAPGRVAKALLDLAVTFGEPVGDGVNVCHGLTQEELAQLVGASRETVNKVLSDFALRGWLRQQSGEVILLDIDRLNRRSTSFR